MPTNEERREVAARLRDIAEKTWYTSWHELYTIKNACGCYDDQDSQDIVLKDRLADLIEPEPERTCGLRSRLTGPYCYECTECGGCMKANWAYCPSCGSKVVNRNDR